MAPERLACSVPVSVVLGVSFGLVRGVEPGTRPGRERVVALEPADGVEGHVRELAPQAATLHRAQRVPVVLVLVPGLTESGSDSSG